MRWAKEVVARAKQDPGSADGLGQHFFGAERGFVQIYLPVHQAAGGQKVFNAINALFLYNDMIIKHIQHLDDAIGADIPF